MQEFSRVFTIVEANGTLPFVSRVVRDIFESHKRISELYTRMRRLTEDGLTDAAGTIEKQISDLMRRREEYYREIRQVGCEFKGSELGLVDFPARIGDREVYLCWRLGEPEIKFWHELESGFAGRQPVDGHFPSEEPTPLGVSARD